MKADLEAMLCAGQSAPQAIAQIVKENPDMAVGAANIIGFTQAREAVEAGAKWITTSGLREDVICWCKENDVVVIPVFLNRQRNRDCDFIWAGLCAVFPSGDKRRCTGTQAVL